MKKNYFLLLLLIVSGMSFGQVFITELADPNDDYNARYIELYNAGATDVDLSTWRIDKYTNASATVSQTLALTGTITAGGFYIIASGSENTLVFDTWGVTPNQWDGSGGNVAGGNGDDNLELYDASGLVDQFGVPGEDGSGTGHEFEDGRAERKSFVTSGNTTWDVNEWDIDNDSGGGDGAQNTTDSFDPGTWIGTSTGNSAAITITAPSDGAVIAAGTTAATISVNVANFTVDQAGGSGDGHIHWTVDGVDQAMKYDTLDESITVTDGGSYTVVMTLVDNSHVALDPVVSSTTTFTVAYPCDLQLGTITTTCDATTNGTDTYTTTIDYTGGGSSIYTIDTASNGTIAGDDPSTVATGTISISGITEGVDFTTTVTGDTANSSCNITRNITSPVCVVSTCANAGDIIITEIMQNPSAVGDSYGEYFEVYNTTTAAIDMQGWQVVDLTSTSEGFTIASSVVVPALGYAVFVGNGDISLNGGVTADYAYDGTSTYLGNSSDELSIQCSGNVIDEVLWDNGTTFPDPTGISMELSTNAFTATDNDLGSNWGAATAAYGDGDLGTPGTVNNFLSIADNVIEGFTIFPNPTNTTYIQITTASSNSKQVRVFDMLGKKIIDKNIQHQLNISALQAGIYIIKVTVDGQSATKRLIVQ